MTRRTFALVAAGAWSQSRGADASLDLSGIPNFCSHEHWGSIDSIGAVPQGYRADVEQGAHPHGRTGLLDILLEPYFRGNLSAAGSPVNMPDLKDRPLTDALEVLRPALDSQRFTGTYQCTRRGLKFLHGADVSNLDSAGVARLDASIAQRYSRHLDWYRAAMKQAHFSELIRPVHPEFYATRESAESAKDELSFTHTVMRIDPLIDLWRQPQRKRKLAAIASVVPSDAASWRAFLGRLFDLAARNGALGIKQLQAYQRDLNFLPRKDEDVIWTGDLDPLQARVFGDWIVHECCKQAHERGWPQQVHVGTHNIGQSSPMPLLELARRYPAMKIVMIHCWPFLKEAGWLAKYQANMYIDTCWQPILSPGFLAEAMSSWVTYVPANKITCGHDATTVEMAVGSSLFTREILSRALGNARVELRASESDVRQLATDFLHNNAVRIYGTGATIRPAAAARAEIKSEATLATISTQWPMSRFVEIWNSIPGQTPVKKFSERKKAVARIWSAIQPLAGTAIRASPKL